MKRQIGGRALKLDRSIRYLSQPAFRPSPQPEIHDSLVDQQVIIQKGDIIIAAKNFGGIDEAMPEALLSRGVTCIIAASYNRTFYRNCINLGLPVIENAEAFNQISSGETVSIDFDRGEILCRKGTLTFQPFPDILSKILFSGGLIPYTKRTMEK